jgi:hypothetical protein
MRKFCLSTQPLFHLNVSVVQEGLVQDIFSQLRGRSNLIVPKFIMMAARQATAKRPFSFETAAAAPQAIKTWQ